MPAFYVVGLPISLNAPLLVQGNKLEYHIYDKENKLFSGTKDIDFAPMTEVDVALPWEHEDIKVGGTYTVKGELTYKTNNGNDATKEFERDFVFKGEEKDEGKPNIFKAPLEKSGLPLWSWVLMASAVFICLGLALYIYTKGRANRKTDKQKHF